MSLDTTTVRIRLDAWAEMNMGRDANVVPKIERDGDTVRIRLGKITVEAGLHATGELILALGEACAPEQLATVTPLPGLRLTALPGGAV